MEKVIALPLALLLFTAAFLITVFA